MRVRQSEIETERKRKKKRERHKERDRERDTEDSRESESRFVCDEKFHLRSKLIYFRSKTSQNNFYSDRN